MVIKRPEACLSLKHRLQFGNPKEQHEWFAIREWQEAELLVERLDLFVERLDNDSARTNHISRRQRSLPCINQQV